MFFIPGVLYFWIRIALSGDEGRADGHAKSEFALQAFGCFGQCVLQIQSLREIVDGFLIGAALQCVPRRALQVGKGPGIVLSLLKMHG